MKDGVSSDGIVEGWSFRAHLFRPGDVLLCVDPKSSLSRVITGVTGGEFSHAAICTITPLFIEADIPVVREFTMDRKGVADPANARILRLKDSVPNAQSIAAKAADAAQRYSTRDYSVIRAAKSVLPLSNVDPVGGVFCSYLVAAAYSAAGLNVTKGQKSPEKTTPEDIETSPFFQDITDTFLVQAVWRPDWSTPDLLDGEGAHSPAHSFSAALREVSKNVAEFLVAKGQVPVFSYPEAQIRFMRSQNEPWFLELDAKFAQWIDEIATPHLVEGEQLADVSRQKNAATIRERIDAADGASLMLMLEFRVHRIQTLVKLIQERDKWLDVYPRFAQHVQRLRLLEVMEKHDIRIRWQYLVTLKATEKEAVECAMRAKALGLPLPPD